MLYLSRSFSVYISKYISKYIFAKVIYTKHQKKLIYAHIYIYILYIPRYKNIGSNILFQYFI